MKRFINVSPDIEVFGESISLKMKSNPLDKDIIKHKGEI